MTIWNLIESAPQDGSLDLGCVAGEWNPNWGQWEAPQAIRFGGYHPNAPGKKCWRDKDGHPVSCTHWIPLMKGPGVESR